MGHCPSSYPGSHLPPGWVAAYSITPPPTCCDEDSAPLVDFAVNTWQWLTDVIDDDYSDRGSKKAPVERAPVSVRVIMRHPTNWICHDLNTGKVTLIPKTINSCKTTTNASKFVRSKPIRKRGDKRVHFSSEMTHEIEI